MSDDLCPNMLCNRSKWERDEADVECQLDDCPYAPHNARLTSGGVVRACPIHGKPYPLREWRGKMVEDSCPDCLAYLIRSVQAGF